MSIRKNKTQRKSTFTKRNTRKSKTEIKTKIKTDSKTKSKTKKVYNKGDFKSGDGMLTTVWGPGMWHYLHTMSFNYPVNPTEADKHHYRRFVLNLQHVLPCKYCRINLKENFKKLPLKPCVMKNRDTFSRYVYNLHEHINKMLKKKSGLTYCKVRERYEHFRARCVDKKPLMYKYREPKNKTKKLHKGCTEPLYGEKAKCIIKIVPQKKKCETFQMDDKCVKKRGV